jgi:hypothetical protein
VAGAGIATCGAALIPLRIAQPIRLGVEQSVQRFLHGAPHHPLEVALDPLVVNRDDVVQLLAWLRLATSSSARFGAASPYLTVRKILYVICGPL